MQSDPGFQLLTEGDTFDLCLPEVLKNACNLSDFLLDLIFSKLAKFTWSIKEDLVGLTIKSFDENRILYEYLDSIDIM